MVSGYTELVEDFDRYVTKNFNSLRTSAKQVFWGADDAEDHLIENLIKVRNRIALSGFTGGNYGAYLYLSNTNSYRLKKKREARKTFLDIFDPEVGAIANDYLLLDEHDSQTYRNDVQLLVRCLFKYVYRYYSNRDAILFLTYYLTPYNTYSKLAEHSNLEFKSIKNKISLMKKDLRINLIPFVKFETTTEVFRPVRHYEDYYEVSNKGRVRNKRNYTLKGCFNVFKLKKGDRSMMKSLEQLQTVFKPTDIISFQRQVIK